MVKIFKLKFQKKIQKIKWIGWIFSAACVQESFSASGSLDTLCLALVHCASAADTSLLLCQLCVTISKTLSACIADNCA